MNCKNLVRMPSGIYRRCGKCIFCRITETLNWKIRLLHELKYWDSAMFVTLTFDNEHLGDNSLSKKEFSDFHKRVRKHICLECEHYQMAEADYDYKAIHCGKNCSRRIKHYGAGEYCPSSGRKHYHDIIFGLSPYDDKDRKIIVDSWKNCPEWQFLRSRGKKSAIGSVTPDSIQYVTGYVRKKLGGQDAVKVYGDRQPPFSLCSKGLGKQFCIDNADKLMREQIFWLKGNKVGLPRYYRDKLGINALAGNIKPVSSDVDSVKFREETKQLTDEFLSDMLREKGYTPDLTTIRGHMQMQRFFGSWYDNKMSSYTQDVFEDFYRREKMKTGKLDGFAENFLRRKK